MIKKLAFFAGSVILSAMVCRGAVAEEVAREVAGEVKNKEPEVHASGAVIMDIDSGRVLWEKNAHTKMPMASTTKIMTAIVALEKGDFESEVTVSKRAAVAPRVKMYLSSGEKIQLIDLLYALMLQSSNDAAVAIAEHVGGSVEAFCEMMTEKAKIIGAYDTKFETPNGLDSENHYSTAYDLAVIAGYALQNSKFVEIINTKSYHAKSSVRSYDIINKNRFLYEYKGAFGVKTGFTGNAGHCFVGAAKNDDMSVITVALASGWGTDGKERKWTDTKLMMDYAFSGFSYETVIEEGEKAGEIAVSRSKTVTLPVYFTEKIVLPLSEGERNDIQITVSLPEEIAAPIEKGDFLGTAAVYAGDVRLAAMDLFAGNEIERHDLKTSAEKVLKAFVGLCTGADIEVTLPEF